MFYSKSLNGFIPAKYKVDGTYTEENWPDDAVMLTEDEILSFVGVSTPSGKLLGEKDGRPAWVDIPPPPPLTRNEIEALRLRAYADPLIGSDRYFSEAQRMQAMGEVGWESVRDYGVIRFEEIQAQYPWL